ncbi:hypothetical protein [Fischerella sp. FACHB-380]|uniref:hypothetical protein n=1 Tax=Fischerella sp. FACHB-380 TaxID=2692799 RepID=UPI0016878F5D|nr:hypothetical protein [Fischerella sp. FACHB-380]
MGAPQKAEGRRQRAEGIFFIFPISPSPYLPITPLPLIPNARCFMPGNPSTALAPPCRSWGPVSSPSPHFQSMGNNQR